MKLFLQLYGFVCFGTEIWHLPLIFFVVVLTNGRLVYATISFILTILCQDVSPHWMTATGT